MNLRISPQSKYILVLCVTPHKTFQDDIILLEMYLEVITNYFYSPVSISNSRFVLKNKSLKYFVVVD